jgi:hypothetical protein
VTLPVRHAEATTSPRNFANVGRIQLDRDPQASARRVVTRAAVLLLPVVTRRSPRHSS